MNAIEEIQMQYSDKVSLCTLQIELLCKSRVIQLSTVVNIDGKRV